jgi:transposase
MDDTSAPRYIPINRNQKVLQPLDIENLIPAEHPARKIWAVVGGLDLSRFEEQIRAVEGRAGRDTFAPQLLVSIWIYAYSKGIHSAREIERQMAYEPALQWLAGLRTVNHHTLSDFRVEHAEARRELFTQVLALLTMNKLITLERVATDGTKIRAHVNKKSFSRAHNIRLHLKLAQEHVAELEHQEAEEQTTKRQQAARRRAARDEQQRLEEALAEIQLLRAEKKHDKQKEPQASTTDPQARFMRTPDGGLAPAYNVQISSDAAHGLIADVEVINDPQDAQQLAPATDRLQATFERYPEQMLADGGYTNNESVLEMAERGVDLYGKFSGRGDKPSGRAVRQEGYDRSCFAYEEASNEFVCPEGKRLRHKRSSRLGKAREQHVWSAAGDDCRACDVQALCCPGIDLKRHGRSVALTVVHPAVEAFDEKMRRPEAQALYKQRAPLAEFPNAWIKDKFKLRRFVTRGLAKVKCEALWAALTFNLQGMFRLAPQLVPTA